MSKLLTESDQVQWNTDGTKRHIVYIEGQGFEWLEDPKQLAAIIRNRSKTGAKPHRSLGRKDLGKSDPEAFDELEDVEAKLYQQDTGISINASRGRFDMQFFVKRLSEMMTKPRKLGNLRLARLARYLVGTQKLTFTFDHQEYSDIVRIPVDSDWAGSAERPMQDLNSTEDNEAVLGTKDFDGPTHQRLLQKLPLKPTQCRRLLELDRDSKRRKRRKGADGR